MKKIIFAIIAAVTFTAYTDRNDNPATPDTPQQPEELADYTISIMVTAAATSTCCFNIEVGNE